MYISTADMERSSNESIEKGLITPSVMTAYLVRILFEPAEYGGQFMSVDNELLMVKGKMMTDVEVILRRISLLKTTERKTSAFVFG